MNGMQQMQVALPPPRKLFTPGVTGVLVASVVGFLVHAFAPGFAADILGVSADGVVSGRLWQMVTYAFVHDSVMMLVFNGMMILFIGSIIEREWRTASFLTLWVVVSIVCGLLWAGVTLVTGSNAVGFGATACCYGFISTLGLLRRGTRFFMFFGTVEAQHLALILIAIGIIMNIMTPMTLVWIAGALVAYLYVKAVWSRAGKKPARVRSRDTASRGNFVDID